MCQSNICKLAISLIFIYQLVSHSIRMTTFVAVASALVTLTIVHHGLAMKINDQCQCGQEVNIVRRIIGGKEVAAEKYPWLVLVVISANYRENFCTGSIITDRHVLLASHCLNG